MNVPNKNHNVTLTGDDSDRLIDVALAELVGGATPPDLTSRVLSDNVQLLAATPKRHRTQTKLGFWVSFAAAAVLLAAATLALLPDFRNARDVKRTVLLDLGLQNQHPPAEPLPTGAPTQAPSSSLRSFNESIATNNNTLAAAA